MVKGLETVYVDLMGPQAVQSATGNLYIMDIIDDFSSYSWSIPLASKAAAFPVLIKWQLAVELAAGLGVGRYRYDNSELKVAEMTKWLASQGTKQQFTAPHMSAHNGQVEHLHCTLMDKACTMRIHTGLPQTNGTNLS